MSKNNNFTPKVSVKASAIIEPLIESKVFDGCRVCTYPTHAQPQVWLGKDKAISYDYLFDIGAR